MKRRDFIRSSAAFSSFSLLSGSSIANVLQTRKLGVALVGLGYYSRDLLAPALQLTKHCELRGIVTGSPEKIPVWQRKYGIKDSNVYNYQNMGQIANNDDIDVIYIVLPNSMHAEYAIKAANAGKHVWCEKPMARTVAECQSIIDACDKNNRYLTIGYRMQHEPKTQKIIKWADSKPYGKILNLKAEAGFFNSGSDHWKLQKAMGGGAMYDMGVYSLNAARYVTGEEPIAVTATHSTTRPDIFDEVDETTTFKLEFPGGAVANCKTSFGANLNELKVNCAKGWYALSPFQAYSGIRGKTSDGKLLNATIPNEQARQMDDDALAIMNRTQVLVPGEEGLLDVKVVEAIYQSAREGKRITLS
ncbi:MAG: Gfo/Idh/MocA family oxidoreductase [Marinoscillum sp.]